MRLALYQPDIPQNTGTILRMAACLGVPVDIIGPAGFDMSDRALRRAGLDYLGAADFERHASFAAWQAARFGDTAVEREGSSIAGDDVGPSPRLVLLTTRGEVAHVDFAFRAGDILLLGRESAGVPDAVHDLADARLRVPMQPGLRSLNVAVAAAIVVGEALRQTGGWPVR